VTPHSARDLLPFEILPKAQPKKLSLLATQLARQHLEIQAEIPMRLGWLERRGESLKDEGVHRLDEPLPASPTAEVHRATIPNDHQKPRFEVLDPLPSLQARQGCQARFLEEVVFIAGRNSIPRHDRLDPGPEETQRGLDLMDFRRGCFSHRRMLVSLSGPNYTAKCLLSIGHGRAETGVSLPILL
jgi:hypothetical protein